MVTSEPPRPSTEVEVLDEKEASECRHEERCSEVQGMSDDEGEVQCGSICTLSDFASAVLALLLGVVCDVEPLLPPCWTFSLFRCV